MEANQEANNGETGVASLEFRKNMGRLGRLPRDQLVAIARKGGEVRSAKKRLSSQLNPIRTGQATTTIPISRCNECPLKADCEWFEAGMACALELNIRRNAALQFKAFVGSKPEDMLAEMMKLYRVLDAKTQEDPSFHKLLQQMYLLMRIYEMKFGGGEN